MKHLKLVIATLVLALGLGGLAPAMVLAETPQATVCTTLGSNADCTAQPTDNSITLNSAIKALINILSIIIGIVAVIMIMLAGFKYVTASGDSNKASSAKNTLVYAIIGLVIAALAQVIVHFVLEKI